MQVRAFDMDGTPANNIVSFRLADNEEYFSIDYNTGNITALVTFDREATDTYHLKIIAEDNSPSALYNNGKPNSISQTFIIKISDKNDHPPKFTKDYYIAEKIPEDANTNTVVIQVLALDIDTASQITYSIVSGNIGNAFKIDETTGAISVNNELDYENITEYTLQVRAFDGTYDDNATVSIKVENVNDNLPKFAQNEYSLEIDEEKIMDGCIVTIEAWDPDIRDRSDPQHIKFAIVKVEQRPLLEIDDEGCLRQKAPLDRDPPNGHKSWQVIISATDEDGSGRQSTTTVNIILNDTNDNPPFLTNKMPVVWYENQDPGRIVTLTADDYDEPQNGSPFQYEISDSASDDIKQKFRIDTDVLYAQVRFDREQQKEYFIPVLITDSGKPQPLSKVSILHLVIGDVNDNEMQDGESKIFVYNYKGESPNADIGRVYVDDLDDWDLPDKTFNWRDGYSADHFALNTDTGMITMLQGTRGGDYELHSVSAKVLVTVKEIPEEAVDKSGSIRFYGITAEEFVSRSPSLSLTPKDRLQNSIAELFNISRENVDVFTVLQRDNNASLLDVRFSAHGSPYYEPERLNGIIGYNQRSLEDEFGLKMMMVSIDECIEEKVRCELSCKNVLHKSNVPIAVYTNTSSFVGVNAFVQAECVCDAPPVVTECLNGGTPFNDKCECMEGYEGPHCEIISIGFYGHGYAMYPPVSPCNMTRISMELTPQREDGLVMYIGPLSYNPLLPVQDFLALELVKGLPVLLLDYGTGTIRIEHKHRFPQGRPFTVEIVLQPQTVEMIVDNCKLSTCMSLDAPKGPNESLNVNAPLQLGGAAVNLESLGSMFNWTYVPQGKGFSGCLRNLTINDRTYNLGAPSLAKITIRDVTVRWPLRPVVLIPVVFKT
ncbi:AAEL013873-PA [Aedes aegypti]|uniref:AAEL013873-PA n=1 Tax=Aedes aegypti TaxID=7159 RepID=Q16HX2_AEDAE|nr:AAEL013873-PA [Aedes aegypti]